MRTSAAVSWNMGHSGPDAGHLGRAIKTGALAVSTVAIDRHHIGWGLYQTALEAEGTKHGDGEYHPGITVKWRLGGEGSVLGDPVQLCFLLDDTPRPQ